MVDSVLVDSVDIVIVDSVVVDSAALFFFPSPVGSIFNHLKSQLANEITFKIKLIADARA